MQIFIHTIRHSTQRYPTCGDWQWFPDKDQLHICVSQTGSDLYNMLIAIHELVEAFWCIRNGITTAQVDDWDVSWERHRDSNPPGKQMADEPGNDPLAPYHPGHRLADVIERMAALVLHADWEHYEYTLGQMDLVYGRPRYRVEPTATLPPLATRVGLAEPERTFVPNPAPNRSPGDPSQNQKEPRPEGETQAADYGRRSTQVPSTSQEEAGRRTTQTEISTSYNRETPEQAQADADEEVQFAGQGVDQGGNPSPSPVRKGPQGSQDGW